MENERESQAGAISLYPGEVDLKNLILASSSPRRAEILRSVGWEFEQIHVEIDETQGLDEDAITYVERLARQKAEAGERMSAGKLILGADTTVVVDGDSFGKPRDEDEARRMLRRLNGRWHEVVTGIALIRKGEDRRAVVAHETTRVLFAAMSDDEIGWYVSTGEPMDKAGAYAIQGRAALFIERVDGDYWNVVGLPIQLVYRLAQGL